MAVFTIGASSIAGGGSSPTGGGVGGADNLTTVGAVPYVSASGVLGQMPLITYVPGNGNLLVGTTSDNSPYKLQVAGKIIASDSVTAEGGNYFSGSGADISFYTAFGSKLGSTIKASTGNTIFGGSTDGNYQIDVAKSGSTGTARFYDQTATTGSTLVTISRGAGQTNTSNVLAIDGTLKFGGQNTTGAGSAALSTNCPATTTTAPYTWIRAVSSDGSTVYIPCWK